VLLEFADLHGLVDGEGGVANGEAGWGWGVAGGDGNVGTCAVDRVGVAVALGAGHGERAGGDEFGERGALTVERDVATFGVGDREEVATDAGEADGLRASSAKIGGGEFFERKGVEAEENPSDHYQADDGAHKEIVAPSGGMNNRGQRGCVVANNGDGWAGRACGAVLRAKETGHRTHGAISKPQSLSFDASLTNGKSTRV